MKGHGFSRAAKHSKYGNGALAPEVLVEGLGQSDAKWNRAAFVVSGDSFEPAEISEARGLEQPVIGIASFVVSHLRMAKAAALSTNAC